MGYIIERKPYTLTGEGRWLKCNYTNVTDNFFTVTALGEGEAYEFRVIAKNGNQVFSTPSESTGSVQCKTDLGKLYKFCTLFSSLRYKSKIKLTCTHSPE